MQLGALPDGCDNWEYHKPIEFGRWTFQMKSIEISGLSEAFKNVRVITLVFIGKNNLSDLLNHFFCIERDLTDRTN